MNISIKTLFIQTLFILQSSAGELTEALKSSIAKNAFYPVSGIVATDANLTKKQKRSGLVRYAKVFAAEDNSMARFTVAFAPRGSLLSDVEDARLKVSAENSPSGTKRIALDGDGYCYSTSPVVGPGGYGTSILGCWPSQNIDFHISLVVPSDPPLEETLINRAHFNLVTAPTLDVEKILTPVALDWQRSGFFPSAAGGNSAQSPGAPLLPEGLSGPTVGSENPADPGKAVSLPLLLVAALLLAGIVVLVMKARRNDG